MFYVSAYYPTDYYPVDYYPNESIVVTTTAPRVLMRGIVQRAEISSGLLASLSAVDQLFSDSGPFGPDQQWPPLIPASLFPSAPPDSVNRPFPVCYGEKSDEGATDPVTGVARSKGLIPLLYMGQMEITAAGASTSPAPAALVVDESIAGVTIVNVTNARRADTDTGGFLNTTYLFGAVEIDGVVGTITPGNGAFNPYLVNGVDTTGGASNPVPGGIDMHIHFNRSGAGGQKNVRYLFWASTDPHYHPVTNPLAGDQIGTAVHDDVTLDGYYPSNSDYSVLLRPLTQVKGSIWDAYLVCLGASFRVFSLYGSDLGKGIPTNTPDRMKLTLSEISGSSFLVPWDVNGAVDAHWPFPDTFVDVTDADTGTVYRCTLIFGRGPISDDHKNGVVNLAVNMLGREHIGNGRGYPIIDAHPIEQHIFENEFLARKTSGLWVTNATAPKWADGTPIVRSSTFRDRQAFTATALGGRGLTFGFYTDEAKSTTEWVRALMASTETRTGTNGHGQIVKFGLDPGVDTSTWPRIDHVSDIFGPLRRVSGDERENVVLGQCDWDPDAERFRAKAGPTQSNNGITKYKGRKRQGESIDSLFLNSTTQLTWVLARRLERLAFGSTYVDITGGIGFLDKDVGDGILLTSEEGPGANGYEDHPFIIVRRRLNLASLLVTYTLWDVADLLA